MPTTLTRWDPMQEFNGLRSAMDRLFEQSFGRMPVMRGDDMGRGSLSLDIIENGDSYVVKAAVPGVDPKDVDISVDQGVLTIKGEYRHEEETKEENYLRREMQFGSFQRSLQLPPTVEPEKAEATFEHGMLKLTLPKRQEARARSIKITPQGVIEGSQGGNGSQGQQN